MKSADEIAKLLADSQEFIEKLPTERSRSATIEELESDRSKLIELVLTILMDGGDCLTSALSKSFMKSKLAGAEEALGQARATMEENRRIILEQARELKDLSLAAKMYKSDGLSRVSESDGNEAMSPRDQGVEKRLQHLDDFKKRKFGEMNSPMTAAVSPSPPVLQYKNLWVTCISCFTNNRTCDGEDTCSECVKNRCSCKRARCQDYRAGLCKRQSCTRAHEGDEKRYKNIVSAGHVAKKAKVIAKSGNGRVAGNDGS